MSASSTRRPRLGVCYYPEQWPATQWAGDARRMREMGIAVVRIAEFAWARMEPRAGEFDWAWLDQAIDTLAAQGLQIVLGTPTAAPPAWLVAQQPEVLPVDAQGRTKTFGARRHCDFSSPAFHAATVRIVTAMARRYGQHPAVIAWQTDNEYGCHDTTLSYSPAALAGFRRWLAQRYGTVAALNAAWGTAFWSLQVSHFDDIGFPVGQPTTPLPAHALDFRRFASDEVRRYNRLQVDILRAHAPGRDVLHNFMGLFGAFDHHDLAADLDVAAWDNYPLGFTDTAPFLSDDQRQRWARSGHPDLSAFHHDLYRGLCQGRWWVMEQQAGPVNWALWNALPLPGMVRAWTWEAIAHGAELVSYFRWRQLPYGQEQMHSGLHRPDDQRDSGGDEAAQVAAELAALPSDADLQTRRAPVALVFDYTSHWMTEIQPQGADMGYFGQVFAAYTALRQLGLDVDIVSQHSPLAGYALVVVPALLQAGEPLAEQLAGLLAGPDSVVVLGHRSGSKTPELAIPAGLPPGPLARLMPIRVRAVESLRPGTGQAVLQEGATVGLATQWRDIVEPLPGRPAPTVLAHCADGHPAWLQLGRCFWQSATVDAALQQRWLAQAATLAGLAVQTLPEGLRLRRRGAWQFAINRGPTDQPLTVPDGARFLLGGPVLPPAGVAAWHLPDSPSGSPSGSPR